MSRSALVYEGTNETSLVELVLAKEETQISNPFECHFKQLFINRRSGLKNGLSNSTQKRNGLEKKKKNTL